MSDINNKIPFSSAMVVGAGIMGHGIAQVLATHNIRTYLVDNDNDKLDKSKTWISDNLRLMVDVERIDNDKANNVLSNIYFVDDYTKHVSNVPIIIEAISENYELKKRLWEDIGKFANTDTILSSNTSSYDIDDITVDVPNKSRIVATHWFHPPHITPCVEVIPSKFADSKYINITVKLLKVLGKHPTICKSAPGFVANRIQMAMAAEAISLVEENLAEPEDIDRIVKSSFGFRLSAFGPFEIMDHAGADVYLGVYEYLYEKLNKEQFKPPSLLIKQVSQNNLGLKTLKGFYKYNENDIIKIKNNRDISLFERLDLINKQQKT